MHPHDNDSILRIALVDEHLGKEFVKQILSTIMDSILNKFNTIKGLFDGRRSRSSNQSAKA